MEPGQTFNTVAAIYDAQRSGYPEALFDDLLEMSRLGPGCRVLEVGCGTGQATAGFAERGLRVVAIDPGDRLLDVARPKFDKFPHVQFESASFEDWPLGERTFDLVAAAQSWHWVRPEIGFEKASKALSPGGRIAISATPGVGRPRSWTLCSRSIFGWLRKSGVLRRRIGIFLKGRFPLSLRRAAASSQPLTATTHGRANIPRNPS
jgi:SAM-dependent methyltransferase